MEQLNDKTHLDLMQNYELDDIIETFCSNIDDELVSYERETCDQSIQVGETIEEVVENNALQSMNLFDELPHFIEEELYFVMNEEHKEQ